MYGARSSRGIRLPYRLDDGSSTESSKALRETIMTTKFTDSLFDAERETTNARAELLQRAEAQGIKPFTSLEDFAGDEEMTADFDVDEFLRQVREDRDRPLARSRK